MSKTYEHLNVTIQQAIPMLMSALKADVPAMLWGAPGVGKSSLIRQIGKALKFDSVVVIIPSQIDVVDLSLPYVYEDAQGRKRSAFALSDLIPTSGRHLIFVDEANTASTALQPKLYSLILEGKVGAHTLPEGCRRVAAGNRVTDRAAAQQMASALRNRFGVHLNVIPDVDSWTAWAARNKLAPETIAYARTHPDCLDAFDPDDVAGGCTPRGLEALSKLLIAGLPPESSTRAYYGAIGHGHGAKFQAFLELYRAQISVDEIIKHPKTAPLPEDGSARYCVCSALVARAEADTMPAIYEYCQRMHASQLCMVMSDIKRRDESLALTETWCDFARKNIDLVA